ncbi:tetratricopeptide repeat protein [uncultured Aquimarina sp.]|uniref:tetratricopeptide repeat protein n=1 Tax=uncultured Aquimarina sp. TaxID=575652 RepID=UPI00261EA355|nr:tetratricopeptide repeat protein [uncultured Aquimarina sp.]
MQKKIIVIASILFIGLIITYSNHFDNGFYFDDDHTIISNVHITDIKNIPDFFVNPQMFSSRPDHWGLRPIITTSLAIDYWVGGGLKPFYFHLSTFFWYLTLCILLFFLCRKIFQKSLDHKWNSLIALLSASLYAFHTVNAETINYIISRSDVLSTLCITSSVSIYIIYPKLRKWFIYIIPAIIGVFVKETMAVTPVLLFFYILLFEKETSILKAFRVKELKNTLRIIVHLLPMILIIIVFQLYTLSKAGESGFSNPPLQYLMTQPYVWVHYFISFFLPFNLSADSDWKVITNIFDDRIIIGLIFIIGLVITILKTSSNKETRPISFGLIWFCITLLPTSIAPLAEVMNDHRMFLPFIGLSLSLTYGISLYIINYSKKRTLKKEHKIILSTSFFVIIFLFGYGTYQRNEIWKSSESLWHDVTLKSPTNGRGLMNYGLTQMEKGNYPTALEYYEKALRYSPYYSPLHINMGVVQGALNSTEKAEESFKKAIQYDPNSDTPYYFYARFLTKKKRYIDARKMGEKANEITVYNLNNQYLLMEIYDNLGLKNELNNIAKHTLTISKNNPLALKYLNKKNTEISDMNNAEIEIKNNPTSEKYIDLSLKYYNIGEYLKCIASCNKAIELDPNNYVAYNNICSAYNILEEYQKAEEACEKAISINPNFQLARNNLKVARAHTQ